MARIQRRAFGAMCPSAPRMHTIPYVFIGIGTHPEARLRCRCPGALQMRTIPDAFKGNGTHRHASLRCRDPSVSRINTILYVFIRNRNCASRGVGARPPTRVGCVPYLVFSREMVRIRRRAFGAAALARFWCRCSEAPRMRTIPYGFKKNGTHPEARLRCRFPRAFRMRTIPNVS